MLSSPPSKLLCWCSCIECTTGFNAKTPRREAAKKKIGVFAVLSLNFTICREDFLTTDVHG